MSVRYVQAKFIGTDGSLGYRTGESYRVAITQKFFGSRIEVVRLKGYYDDYYYPSWCPYDDLFAFMQNWELVK